MSSQTDIEAPDAIIARLRAELDMQLLETEELEEKNKEQKQKIRTLELDKRLSAPKPPQPAVSAGSSDSALRNEIARLQEVVAAKDAIIAQRDEQVSHLRSSMSNFQARLIENNQGFTSVNESFRDMNESYRNMNESFHGMTEGLNMLTLEVGYTLEEIPALEKQQFLEELMPKISATNAGNSENTASRPPQPSPKPKPAKPATSSAAGPSQPSPSAPTPAEFGIKSDAGPLQPLPEPTPAELATEPTAGSSQPSQSAPKPAEHAADTASATNVFSTMGYSQALKTPAQKLPHRRAKVPLERSPLFAQLPVTHAELSAKREAAEQTPSEPQRPPMSQKPNKAFTRGGSTRRKDRRGRGDTGGRGNSRTNQGETLQDSTSNVRSPLTGIENAGSKSTDMAVSGSLEERKVPGGRNATSDFKQTLRTSDVKSSVASHAVQIGQGVLTEKDKKNSIDTRGNAPPSGSTSKPIAKRRRERRVSDLTREAFKKFGIRIPSETDTDTEDEADNRIKSVATTAPATPQSPSKDVEDGPQSLHGFGLSSSNVRKRLADEGQPGKSASIKRLRST